MTTPPQPSGGASSTSYWKRRTRNPQPLSRSRRPGAPRRGHSTSSHPCRAWRRLRHWARAADPGLPTQNDGGMFWPGAETRADRYQGTLCSALVLAALRAAPRLSRPTDRHQTKNRSGNAGPRHAVIKSATTKINYKTREPPPSGQLATVSNAIVAALVPATRSPRSSSCLLS
jgi:hypothetical protein